VEIKTDILHARLFGNCNTAFQNKPLIVSSFLRSNIKNIQDIWDESSKQFINLTCKISVLVSTFCTHCTNFVHAWIDF
jgi:hypothetical protein